MEGYLGEQWEWAAEPSFGPRGLVRVGSMPPIREECEGDRVQWLGPGGLWEGRHRRRRLQSTPRTAYKQAGLAGRQRGPFRRGWKLTQGCGKSTGPGSGRGGHELWDSKQAQPNLPVTRFPPIHWSSQQPLPSSLLGLA